MTDQPSRQTLDDVPSRVLTFLIAVGESLPIRAALATKGYTEDEHDLAWSLLKKLSIFPPSAPTLDHGVREAITELDAWDEPNFACIAAALNRLHPEQSKFVFADLEAKQGPESVIGVATLLDRLRKLEQAPERKATRKADHAALATLAARGYTPEERERLHQLVETAQKVVVTKPISDDERTKALLDLYGWITDWATTAKTVIRRRDHLIKLGIAKRKKPVKKPALGTKAPTPAAPAGGAEGAAGTP
jgi:CheY-like chemotaxis protein